MNGGCFFRCFLLHPFYGDTVKVYGYDSVSRQQRSSVFLGTGKQPILSVSSALRVFGFFNNGNSRCVRGKTTTIPVRRGRWTNGGEKKFILTTFRPVFGRVFQHVTVFVLCILETMARRDRKPSVYMCIIHTPIATRW